MDVIKAILMEREMTVRQLSELSGVKKRTLEPYICGKAKWKNARGYILLSVADALNVDPHLLVEGKAHINITKE